MSILWGVHMQDAFYRDNKSRVIRFCSMRPSYFQDTLVSPFESQYVIAACVPSKYYITVIVFKCMVGNDGFEPSSTAPKAASLDQTSPTPHIGGPEGIRTPVCSLKRRALNLSEIQAQWPGERDSNPRAITRNGFQDRRRNPLGYLPMAHRQGFEPWAA